MLTGHAGTEARSNMTSSLFASWAKTAVEAVKKIRDTRRVVNCMLSIARCWIFTAMVFKLHVEENRSE